ncbi:gamma-glutamyltransferase [Novosphingobium sp. B 225]|uniref:gamma-glutamyltransferase n=1 Tax=Novosphingobium sp. B 225 TaxID=1961849 RepID=UPI000B4B047C|nr:gamma-glutamyltransferase [Novosphingobium sp. B 225]
MQSKKLVALFAAPLLVGALLPAPLAAKAAPQVYAKGMVSAADPRASEAGAAMLRMGGSATDAAIAVMLTLTLVEPGSSGIGGGGLFVEAGPDGKVSTIDGRETAPGAANDQWFVRDGKVMSYPDAVPGGTSVGVPGNIALAARAHRLHGRLPWAKLFGPAIKLARDGFQITPRFFSMLKNSSGSGAFISEGKALFYGADGQPLPIGTTVKNPALAATFQAVARGGARAFYSGANARGIVARVTTAPRNPEPMTLADVAGYRAKDRAPVCGTYRLYRICGMGPPSSGGTTVLATLKQLERFDLTALGKDNPVAWHLIAESMRLAYADRAKYSADADFVPVPVAGMIDPGYLAQRSALIDPGKTMASVSAGTPPGAEHLAIAEQQPGEERGTSHFSAIDRRGHAVSYTSTIESAFGSGLVVGGYYLNNELTDFDMNPVFDGKPANNRVQGGKRPRSSMSPSLVWSPDGKLRLAVGAAGGATIPAQVIRAIIGVIDWKLPAQDALGLPVVFAPGVDTVFVEKGSWLEGFTPQLQALGHTSIVPRVLPLKANAIEVVNGKPVGAADPRSEGQAISE